MIDYIESDAPIETQPSVRRCEEIVRSYAERRRPQNDNLDRHRIDAEIPFVVTDERITFDEQKIEEMDLFCPEHELYGGDRYYEYPGTAPAVDTFDWHFDFIVEPTMMSDMSYDDAVEFYTEHGIEQIARNIHGVCTKGFISSSITGNRMERREKVDQTLDYYVTDDPDPEEFEAQFETVTRTYDVGTRRRGIGGVIGDAAWYEAHTDEL